MRKAKFLAHKLTIKFLQDSFLAIILKQTPKKLYLVWHKATQVECTVTNIFSFMQNIHLYWWEGLILKINKSVGAVRVTLSIYVMNSQNI